jgi:flagellar protein FliS
MMPNAKAAYMDASVNTASPARLLVMLYERLVLDVHRGLDAQRSGDKQEAHNQLIHAQEIVIELRSSLKVDDWEGGPGMASIYDWLHTQLVKANVNNDAQLTDSCLSIVVDLSNTWRQAALINADVPVSQTA